MGKDTKSKRKAEAASFSVPRQVRFNFGLAIQLYNWNKLRPVALVPSSNYLRKETKQSFRAIGWFVANLLQTLDRKGTWARPRWLSSRASWHQTYLNNFRMSNRKHSTPFRRCIKFQSTLSRLSVAFFNPNLTRKTTWSVNRSSILQITLSKSVSYLSQTKNYHSQKAKNRIKKNLSLL